MVLWAWTCSYCNSTSYVSNISSLLLELEMVYSRFLHRSQNECRIRPQADVKNGTTKGQPPVKLSYD